jgi:hypothetical protein
LAFARGLASAARLAGGWREEAAGQIYTLVSQECRNLPELHLWGSIVLPRSLPPYAKKNSISLYPLPAILGNKISLYVIDVLENAFI